MQGSEGSGAERSDREFVKRLFWKRPAKPFYVLHCYTSYSGKSQVGWLNHKPEGNPNTHTRIHSQTTGRLAKHPWLTLKLNFRLLI